MAGRGGRGGGRGRGRAALSFSVEQLGFQTGEALPGTVLQPPPLYPPMENKPAPLETRPESEYLIALKRDFIEYLHDSPAYYQPAAAKHDIDRYSDRYQSLAKPANDDIKFDWKRFPAELRPPVKVAGKKRKAQKDKAKNNKAAKVEDVSKRLEELEKREQQGSDAEAEPEETEGKEDEDEKEGDGEEVEELEEEDVDEEMDDGTDYVNNYFDNGENYLDEEDDNLDDGPVY